MSQYRNSLCKKKLLWQGFTLFSRSDKQTNKQDHTNFVSPLIPELHYNLLCDLLDHFIDRNDKHFLGAKKDSKTHSLSLSLTFSLSLSLSLHSVTHIYTNTRSCVTYTHSHTHFSHSLSLTPYTLLHTYTTFTHIHAHTRTLSLSYSSSAHVAAVVKVKAIFWSLLFPISLFRK